ncbi:hypothetical protein ACJRO7_017199 [Eucalyptus globulus]|uniref:Uncharacterized protein n=1 Tax=Eucalyptus globulus TaxID=34317 RepID=A0ABD3L0N4_EUCGL
MASLQEKIVDQPIVIITRRMDCTAEPGQEADIALNESERQMLAIMEKADGLRPDTLEEMVAALLPVHAVDFLVAIGSPTSASTSRASGGTTTAARANKSLSLLRAHLSIGTCSEESTKTSPKFAEKDESPNPRPLGHFRAKMRQQRSCSSFMIKAAIRPETSRATEDWLL